MGEASFLYCLGHGYPGKQILLDNLSEFLLQHGRVARPTG